MFIVCCVVFLECLLKHGEISIKTGKKGEKSTADSKNDSYENDKS